MLLIIHNHMYTILHASKVRHILSAETISKFYKDMASEMDNMMMDMLPIDVVHILDMLFKKGNTVKDFKLAGNSHGFSITLHLCNPHGNHIDWSPNNINSTQSQHKSPANHSRDQLRRQEWLSKQPESSSPMLCNRVVSKDVGQQCVLPEVSKLVTLNTTTPDSGVNTSQSTKVSVNNAYTHSDISTDSDDSSSDTDTDTVSDKCTTQEKSEAARQQLVLLNDNVAKQRFLTNICDAKRNKTFNKIVHDRRKGENCLFGLTDDLMIFVDVTNEKFCHDILLDGNVLNETSEGLNMMQCLKQWSPITGGAHTAGVDMLKLLLPNLVEEHQELIIKC